MSYKITASLDSISQNQEDIITTEKPYYQWDMQWNEKEVQNLKILQRKRRINEISKIYPLSDVTYERIQC